MPKRKLCTIKNSREILDIIHAIYRVASSTFTVKDLLSGLLRIIHSNFCTTYCSIIIFYPNRFPFVKAVIETGKRFFFKRGRKRLLAKKEKEIFSSGKSHLGKKTLITPLVFINTLGIITIKRNKQEPEFNDADNEFLKILAEEISLVVRNFQLYEEQHKTIVGTVKALTQFLNLYTPTSSIHAEYTQKILRELVKKINLTESQVISLEYATFLHDAGKIEIPQHLLKKSAPLTDEEQQIIRKHPTKGVKILKNLQALRPVIPIILYHHEKYDGTGYPSGLKKKNIPIEARIMAIIDAFDAMVFGRPYKKRLGLKQAVKELEKNKGTQFDPEIVDAFVKTLHKKDIKKYLKKRLKKV